MVGNELENIIDSYFYKGSSQNITQAVARFLVRPPTAKKNCTCANVIDLMNRNGAAWCKKRKIHLIRLIYNNAVKYSVFHSAKFAKSQIEELISSWIDQAIERTV